MAKHEITVPISGQVISHDDNRQSFQIYATFTNNTVTFGSGNDKVYIIQDKDLLDDKKLTAKQAITGNIFHGGAGEDSAWIQLAGNIFDISVQDDGAITITDKESGDRNTFYSFEGFSIQNKDGSELLNTDIAELQKDHFLKQNPRTSGAPSIIGSFDPVLARELFALSHFSYNSLEKGFLGVPDSYTYPNRHEITVGNVKALVVNDGKRTLVTFNGTDSKADISSSLNTEMVETPLGGVHSGYFQRLHHKKRENPSVWEQVQAAVNAYNDPVYFTGHSMGGSVAQLAAAQYAKEHGAEKIAALYTFGQPKAGSSAFTAKMDALLGTRYVRLFTEDPIAGFPIDTRYAHGGQPYHLREVNHPQGFTFACVTRDETAQQRLENLGKEVWESREVLRLDLVNGKTSLFDLIKKYPAFLAHANYASALNDVMELSPGIAQCNDMTENATQQLPRVPSGRIVE